MSGLGLIMFILIALGITIGLMRPKRVGSLLLWLIFVPVLIGMGFNMGQEIFWSLSRSTMGRGTSIEGGKVRVRLRRLESKKLRRLARIS